MLQTILALLVWLQTPTPTEALETLFGYIISFLTIMGLMPYFVAAFLGIIVIGLTLRFLDAIGGGK